MVKIIALIYDLNLNYLSKEINSFILVFYTVVINRRTKKLYFMELIAMYLDKLNDPRVNHEVVAEIQGL